MYYAITDEAGAVLDKVQVSGLEFSAVSEILHSLVRMCREKVRHNPERAYFIEEWFSPDHHWKFGMVKGKDWRAEACSKDTEKGRSRG